MKKELKYLFEQIVKGHDEVRNCIEFAYENMDAYSKFLKAKAKRNH